MARKRHHKADGTDHGHAAAEDQPGSPARARTARVTLPGHGQCDVEVPADHPDPHAAAVEAYKAKHGLWALPHQPHVEFDPKPAGEDDAEAGDDDAEAGDETAPHAPAEGDPTGSPTGE